MLYAVKNSSALVFFGIGNVLIGLEDALLGLSPLFFSVGGICNGFLHSPTRRESLGNLFCISIRYEGVSKCFEPALKFNNCPAFYFSGSSLMPLN
jgi:hypothetical protein